MCVHSDIGGDSFAVPVDRRLRRVAMMIVAVIGREREGSRMASSREFMYISESGFDGLQSTFDCLKVYSDFTANGR